MEFVEDGDVAWRATLGSNRRELVGEDVRLVPDFTRAMASDLVFRETPAEEPEPSMFSGLFAPGTPAWKDFFSTRKVVSTVLEDGVRVRSVTSNVAEAVSSPQPASVESVGKRYEVAHLLTDAGLVSKFALRGSYAAQMRNLAVVDTQKAARMLQAYVRTFEGSERAVVDVGKYAGSWKSARDSIKRHAARFPPMSVRTDACVIGDKIFMYGPQGESGWRVFGPVACAALVHKVMCLVEASSCEAVVFAFGTELTLLDIDVHDGEEVMCPMRECHAGSHSELPHLDASAVTAFLSTEGRLHLEALCGACETLAVDGENVATAVRITARYVLVNAHVVREGGSITSNGQPVTPFRMISPDLWLAKVQGEETAWHMRPATQGERVIVCYRRNAELQFLGPLTVLSVGDTMLALERDRRLSPGMSGAAVVALRDSALLGLHDGVTFRKALVAAFTPMMFTDICEMSELGDSSHSSARQVEGTAYSRLKARGLGKILDAAIEAVCPLYSGDLHVGMGFQSSGKLLTLCDPNVNVLALGTASQPLVFSEKLGFFRAEPDRPLPAGPALVRAPSYGEKVFVVGKDAEGGYFSKSPSSKISHIGVGAAHFQVVGLEQRDALPLMGGLVVAESDAAVLGVYKSAVYDGKHGHVVQCSAFPREEPSEEAERPEAALQRLFPFLRPGAWPEGVAQGVLTHSSLGGSQILAYAMVGDSAMRTHLWARLLDEKIPTSKWQGWIQADQANAVQAAKCEGIGLDKLLRTGGGLRVSQGSKVHADLLEAVAGAIYLHDTSDAFSDFCRLVGAVREAYDSG